MALVPPYCWNSLGKESLSVEAHYRLQEGSSCPWLQCKADLQCFLIFSWSCWPTKSQANHLFPSCKSFQFDTCYPFSVWLVAWTLNVNKKIQKTSTKPMIGKAAGNVKNPESAKKYMDYSWSNTTSKSLESSSVLSVMLVSLNLFHTMGVPCLLR